MKHKNDLLPQQSFNNKYLLSELLKRKKIKIKKRDEVPALKIGIFLSAPKFLF